MTPTNPPQYSIEEIIGNLCDAGCRINGDPADGYGDYHTCEIPQVTQKLNQLIYTQVLELIPEKIHSPRLLREKLSKLPQNTGITNANYSSVALGYNLAIDDMTERKLNI
jgi:hypothetical protein